MEFQSDGIERVMRTLNSMTGEIKKAEDELPHEVNEWQLEDMNRKYPNTVTDSESTYTLIWPTSRARRQVYRSSRPILRPVLLEKFKDRMIAVLEKIKWQT